MKLPVGPKRTPVTTSSLPVQTLPRLASIRTGAAGNACQPAARGRAELVEPHATSRKASALPRPATVAATTSFLTRDSVARDIDASSGCVGEGVVEGVEGPLALDWELEPVARSRVRDRDCHRVLERVPEEDDGETVALPAGELSDPLVGGCCLHRSASCCRSATAPSPSRNGSVTAER